MNVETVIDLTHDIHEGMTTFYAPWHPSVSIKQLGRFGFEGRETREVCFGTHTGTQVDAPLHFVEGGKSIDRVPIEQLVGPVTILDFRNLGPNGVVTKDSLRNVKVSLRMLFYFGWDQFWNTKKFYKDWPYFSPDCAQYLVDQGLQLIGFDTCSPDDSRIVLAGDLLGSEQDSPIHKILLRKNIAIAECLANLGQIAGSSGWNVAALPLRIRGADGSPARICAFK